MTVETSKVEQSLETIDKDAAETVKGAAVAPFAATSEWLDRLFPSADAQARQLLSAAYSHYAASDHGLAASAEERGTRLTALRIELARLGLDGFLVPRTDEYLGQYVSLRAMRLHWLTGYSGSNGVAVVLKDRAVILADGRYTLQLSQQIDPRLFEQVDSDRTPLHTWLADNLPKESSLGYDPWLHSASELERLSRACKLTQSQVRRVHRNPIDSLWHDQPPEPLGAIVPHPVSYAGMSSADKRRELASELRADAAVISAAESVAWLLNIRGADAGFVPLPLSRAILHIDGRVDWFVDRRKLTPEVEPLLDRSVKVHAPEALSQVLGDLGQRRARVRLCPESAPAWIHDHLTDAGADLRHAPDPCALPRACKNAVEVQGARNASVRDGAAMVRFLAMMAREAPNGGLTEMEAAQRLLAIRREMPLFRGPSINTISSTGPNGAVIHYRVNATTNRLIESGSLYLVDSGGQYLDGTTDLTRTVAIGTPSLEQRRRFTLVLKGHIALAQLRFPRGTAGTSHRCLLASVSMAGRARFRARNRARRWKLPRCSRGTSKNF